MLELRPDCECRDTDLPPDSTAARTSTRECTFCAGCAPELPNNPCPDRGGEPVSRPRRPTARLARFPASTPRVLKSGGCGRAA